MKHVLDSLNRFKGDVGEQNIPLKMGTRIAMLYHDKSPCSESCVVIKVFDDELKRGFWVESSSVEVKMNFVELESLFFELMSWDECLWSASLIKLICDIKSFKTGIRFKNIYIRLYSFHEFPLFAGQKSFVEFEIVLQELKSGRPQLKGSLLHVDEKEMGRGSNCLILGILKRS